MQHMRKLLFLSVLGFLASIVSCKKNEPVSTPQRTRNLNFTKAWSKVNGGSSYDHYWSGTGTADGGYIAVGYTASADGDISGLKGQTDALVVKYDAAGNKAWQLLIGGSDQDYATAIHQLSDGNYIGVGYGLSKDGDMAGNHGGMDALVFKLSGSGAIQWARAIGGTGNEAARSMVVNTDGTFILAGSQPNTANAATDSDGWVCKLDQSGNMLWEKR